MAHQDEIVPVQERSASSNSLQSKTDPEKLDTTVQTTDVDHGKHVVDEVWGDLEGKVNYRGLSFWGAVVLLIKTQIGVGVLSFPFVLQVLGLIPGLICFFVIAGITTWSDLAIGDFKARHPDIYALDDLGYYLFGKIGKLVFSILIIIYYLVAAGPTISSIATALNGVSVHGACTAVFVAVAAIATFLFASIQTMSKLAWVGYVGCVSVLVAIMTLTVAVGVQERPSAAPQSGPWEKDFKLVNNPSFIDAAAALGNIVYTVCGTPGFFPVVSEMKEPHLYKKAVWYCQGTIIFFNFLVGTVVYYYCGQYVASPAPGSAGPLLKRIIYGLALPGVLGGAVMIIHVVSKYIFVRILKGSHHLTSKTWQHYVAWYSCTASCTLVSYIIASAVPSFSVLAALGGAFLGPFVSITPYGAMWLKDNWRPEMGRNKKWIWVAGWAMFVVFAGFFIQITGTYGSVSQIARDFASGLSKPFSCADNSGSVKS